MKSVLQSEATLRIRNIRQLLNADHYSCHINLLLSFKLVERPTNCKADLKFDGLVQRILSYFEIVKKISSEKLFKEIKKLTIYVHFGKK